MIKDAVKEAYFGATGMGKSTGVKDRIRDESRVIVYDPEEEYHLERGFEIARSLTDIHNLMIKGQGVRYKIAYQPSTENHEQAVHELCKFVLFAQKPYKMCETDRKVTLVIEELDLSAPTYELPKGQRGFREAVLQGRHYGINVIGVTQSPYSVYPKFRDQCHKRFVYGLGDTNSVNYVKTIILDPNYKDAVLYLEPHEYLEIQRGRVEKKKNTFQ